MIAYPEQEINNFNTLTQATEAFKASEISEESLHKIEQAYPCKLYTPGFFIAVGLGLVTILAFSFTALLLGLLVMEDISSDLSVIFTIMAVLAYIFLEKMVNSKMYFNAGIDNALMILVLLFISGIFISFGDNPSWIWMNGLLMVVALWLSARFADAFMAIVSCAFFFGFCFFLFLKIGQLAIIYFLFVMMLLTGSLYVLVRKIAKQVNSIYERSINALTIFLLVAFYASGNYYVISELQETVSGKNGAPAFAWFFWIFTFSLPLFYILYGVAKKSLLHIRTGIFLMMMMVLTYKYFFILLPLEVEMLFLGSILIVICYFLIKSLRHSRYGFTSENISPRPEWRNIEGLIIAETMSVNDGPKQEDNLYSGGSGGGGGASGDF